MPNCISEDQIKRALVSKLGHLYGCNSLACYIRIDRAGFTFMQGNGNRSRLWNLDMCQRKT